MLGFAGSSYALFAVVWTLMCVLAGAVVTDAMLRGAGAPSTVDAEQLADASSSEA